MAVSSQPYFLTMLWVIFEKKNKNKNNGSLIAAFLFPETLKLNPKG
jgi:hypothetical protein